ncbi:MAG TPA: tetratricopeptide repeat protein [Ramlibacter sp.]|nr:tetratricopeptide repeat protein [Ramlibacter sp.]
MKPFKLLGVSFLACFLHAALAQTAPSVDQPVAGAEGSSSELDQVSRLIKGGKHQDALGLVDIVIKSYEDRYRQGKGQAFSSRSPAEASAYLAEIGRSKGTATEEAGVYSSTWGDAYYLKGFILTDMKRLPEAREALQAAVALAPHNAAYRAELGQVLLKAKAFPESVAEFKQAEADAREYSPPRVRNRELAAALRGQAFVLVEGKKLDDAEKLYQECLQLDSRDPVAQSELRYIAQLRQKAGPPAQPAKPAQ